MRILRIRKHISVILAVGLVSSLLAACGDPTATTAPAPTAKPATAVPTTVAPATVATTTKAAASKEIAYLQAIVPHITGTLDALKKGDVAGAKKVFQNYSDGWKGIEIYVKTRSAQLYDTIEVQNEAKAVKLFENPNANPAEILPLVEGVQKGFNEALQLAIANPNYNPVLDEIAGVRILRVNLNGSIAALKANDVATAKSSFKKFYEGWDDVEQSIISRNNDTYRDIEAKMGVVAKGLLETETPVVAQVAPAADALLASYNSGLKLLTDELAKK